jgi:hypothetical protein
MNDRFLRVARGALIWLRTFLSELTFSRMEALSVPMEELCQAVLSSSNSFLSETKLEVIADSVSRMMVIPLPIHNIIDFLRTFQVGGNLLLKDDEVCL